MRQMLEIRLLLTLETLLAEANYFRVIVAMAGMVGLTLGLALLLGVGHQLVVRADVQDVHQHLRHWNGKVTLGLFSHHRRHKYNFQHHFQHQGHQQTSRPAVQQ